MSRIGKKMIETVAEMRVEWEDEIEREGVLSTEFMRASLVRAYYHGKPVMVPQVESTYQLMDWLMCGEIDEDDLRLCSNVKDLLVEDAA